MRVVIAALILLSNAACNHQPRTPAEGAWQSNRELTLEELREAADFSEDEWRFLSDPTLFGRMIHIYRGNSAVTVFEGECSPVSTFQILDSSTHSTRIRYFDEFYERERIVTLETDDDRLYVPMKLAKGEFRETFTRVSPEIVAARHPCTRSFVAGMP